MVQQHAKCQDNSFGTQRPHRGRRKCNAAPKKAVSIVPKPQFFEHGGRYLLPVQCGLNQFALGQ